MKIYVVMGTTGEYSDEIEWAVKAFRVLGDAEKHILLATQKANEFVAHGGDGVELDMLNRAEIEKINPYDPDMQMCFYINETSYFYYEVELVEEAK